MNITLTLPAHLLPHLVPDGGSVDTTWVVCAAHRPTITVADTPALGGIDAWQPFLPLPSEAAALAWGERWARATHTGIEQLSWTPVDHDGTPGEQLFVEYDDGTEDPAGIAIVPLASLSDDYQPAVTFFIDDKDGDR